MSPNSYGVNVCTNILRKKENSFFRKGIQFQIMQTHSLDKAQALILLLSVSECEQKSEITHSLFLFPYNQEFCTEKSKLLICVIINNLFYLVQCTAS